MSTPLLDRPLRTVSAFANFSKPWFLAAGVIAVAGGPQGRRAALTGVAAIGAASLVTNQPMKRLGRRRSRPARHEHGVPEERWVPMPTSTSFPSGHSASAAAFAVAVSDVLPGLRWPLRAAAGVVAFSRVYTGVHYPGRRRRRRGHRGGPRPAHGSSGSPPSAVTAVGRPSGLRRAAGQTEQHRRRGQHPGAAGQPAAEHVARPVRPQVDPRQPDGADDQRDRDGARHAGRPPWAQDLPAHDEDDRDVRHRRGLGVARGEGEAVRRRQLTRALRAQPVQADLEDGAEHGAARTTVSTSHHPSSHLRRSASTTATMPVRTVTVPPYARLVITLATSSKPSWSRVNA